MPTKFSLKNYIHSRNVLFSVKQDNINQLKFYRLVTKVSNNTNLGKKPFQQLRFMITRLRKGTNQCSKPEQYPSWTRNQQMEILIHEMNRWLRLSNDSSRGLLSLRSSYALVEDPLTSRAYNAFLIKIMTNSLGEMQVEKISL